MATDRVSATLTKEDYDAIMAALATIREKLPFLIELSAKEKTRINRLGDKSEAFVNKALELAKQNPDFLPRNFDTEEMERDLVLFKSLNAIAMGMSRLLEEIEDTEIAAGSEAYLAALIIYDYAKADGELTRGLDGVLDDLGKRFARKLDKLQKKKEQE